MNTTPPILAVTGYSGAGKTTLVEALVRVLNAEGLAVAVVKHDAHGLQIDRAGKDSDRFFQAGATVVVHDPDQLVQRLHADAKPPLPRLLADLAARHDLVIVEGHKETPLPTKLWLRRDADDAPPNAVGPVLLDLGRDDDRLAATRAFLARWLPERWQSRPLRAGLLLGGKSTRMGQPKHLLLHDGASWLARIQHAFAEAQLATILLGAGDLPPDALPAVRLPDVPDRQGPLAGLLAAMRWDPIAAWLIAACDQPRVTADALAWLRGQRRPGVWAILPRHPASGRLEPLLALYEPQARHLLEACNGPAQIGEHPHVLTPTIPAPLLPAWRNLNTPADAATLRPPNR